MNTKHAAYRQLRCKTLALLYRVAKQAIFELNCTIKGNSAMCGFNVNFQYFIFG